MVTAWKQTYNLLAIALLLWLGVSTAAGQFMDDYSTTYIDSWASASGIHGWGETYGTMYPTHEYAVNVTITSPGRTYSNNGGFGSYGWNEVIMPWDSGDLGTYTVEAEHRGWCWAVMRSFAIALSFATATIGERLTTYRDPVRQGPPNSCFYLTLACQSGTPTCTGGWYFNPWTYCPDYLLVHFLTYTRFYQTFCWPVGKGEDWGGGPGPCT